MLDEKIAVYVMVFLALILLYMIIPFFGISPEDNKSIIGWLAVAAFAIGAIYMIWPQGK